jgi:four helix bundle protein
MKTYRDLTVWQRSMSLVQCCYHITRSFPHDERFGLTSQIRRAALSIPCNIAEGAARKSAKVFRSHIAIALGSHAELETLLSLAVSLSCTSEEAVAEARSTTAAVGQMLNRLHQSLAPVTNDRDPTNE